MIASFRFDPSAARTITIDWSNWPFPSGSTIASAVWTVPSAFQILAQSIVGKKTNIKVRFKNGIQVPPTNYEFACFMTTNEVVVAPNLSARDTRRVGIEVVRR